MKFVTYSPSILVAVSTSMVLVGCTTEPTETADVEVHEHELEEHGTTGPHGGHLIELGRNHEYHAELVEGESHESVTIHLLDHDLEPLSVDASSVSLVVTTGGQATTIELAPSEPGGNEFRSNDSVLLNLLQSGDELTGKLRVTIDGVPYTGEWEHHDHDHEEAQ